MSVLAMQNRTAGPLPSVDGRAFRHSQYACQEDLYGDLYGEADDTSQEQEHEAEESDAERAAFGKSECLKGPKAHVLESNWKGRLSRGNSNCNSAPGTPAGFRQSQADTWSTHGDTARSEGGSPRGQSGRASDGEEDGEVEGPSLDTCKAERVRVIGHSPLKPAVVQELLDMEPTFSKGSRIEGSRTKEALQKDQARPLSSGSARTLSKVSSRKHSLLIPEDSSSSSSTPNGTPKGDPPPKAGQGRGRRRSMDMSRLDKSLACEILFGGEDLEHRSPVASPRMLRKKTLDYNRVREHRAHGKSPLMAECHTKGSRSLGHSGQGEEVKAKSTGKSRVSGSEGKTSSAHCHSAGSRSMGHEEAKKSGTRKGGQAVSILGGEGSDHDDDCRIDDFDPVDDYLPYLGVGEAVYDKISGYTGKK